MKHESGLLDRHKCAACFMIAILRKIKLEAVENSPNVSKLLREKIAIEVGLAVLVTMTKSDHTKPENKTIINYWNSKNNKINYPGVLCDHREYAKNWAAELYYEYKHDKLFVLAISHQLFWLDIYNRAVAEGKLP